MTLTELLNQKIRECREKVSRIELNYNRGMLNDQEVRNKRLQTAEAAWEEIREFCDREEIGPGQDRDNAYQALYDSVGIKIKKVPVRYYPGVEKMTGSLHYIYGMNNIESLFNDNSPVGKTFNFKLDLNMGDEKVTADYLFEVIKENCDLEKKVGPWEGWRCFDGKGKLEGYYWADASVNIREHEGSLESVAIQKTYVDEKDPIWKKRADHPVEGYWWVGFNEEVPEELDIPEGKFYYDETKEKQL